MEQPPLRTSVTAEPGSIAAGGIVVLRAFPEGDAQEFTYAWTFTGGTVIGYEPIPGAGDSDEVRWNTGGLHPSSYSIRVIATPTDGDPQSGEAHVIVTQSPLLVNTTATLLRTGGEPTTDIGLWMAITYNALLWIGANAATL